jgi:hypothetical protein
LRPRLATNINFKQTNWSNLTNFAAVTASIKQCKSLQNLKKWK